ncbi:hypothetical protein [Marinitenerispora sediminis]|uniref:hypothetical protein n=1 Tax=Marinitenerispora sediminis TaxID=1931232 RepID=UPI001314DD4E|nr:hypothetical protein [Marinitenerispora sediminis]
MALPSEVSLTDRPRLSSLGYREVSSGRGIAAAAANSAREGDDGALRGDSDYEL